MRVRLLLAVATATLFLGLAPAVHAQSVGITNPNTSTPTKLYFHLIDFQDFPINTQKPDDKYKDASGIGLGTVTTSCLPDDVGGNHPFTAYHTYYGYSSPSYVEYNFEVDGKPRTHPERGISYDAILDNAYPSYLYWYIQTSSGVPSSGTLPTDPNNAPTVIPNMFVQATIRAGDAISVDDKAYNSGPELVKGATKPVTIVSGQQPVDSTGAASTEVKMVSGQPPNGPYVYEFKVPLTIDSNIIPRATGYNLRVDMRQDVQTCNDASDPDKAIMQNNVWPWTSPEFRPRMELAIMDPIRLEYLHPQFVGDDLVIHTSMNSAWGNYDVDETDPDGIAVTVTGPSPATSLAKAAIVQRTHEHYHHQEAVDITYVWPYKTDRAQNGLYTVDVKFMNDQRSATAEGVAQFEIGKGTVIGCGGVQESAKSINNDCASQVQEDGVAAKKKSPGFELVSLVGILGGALAVARIRRKA